MSSLRAFVRRNPAVAALIVALALMLRALVPGGFMPTADHGRIVISICTGSGPVTAAIAVPGADHGEPGDHAKSDQPCAFAGLSLTLLGGADVALLLVALAFIVALAFAPVLARNPGRIPHLRPPLRGPPVLS